MKEPLEPWKIPDITKDPYRLWLWLSPENREKMFSPARNRLFKKRAFLAGKILIVRARLIPIKTRMDYIIKAPFNRFRKPRPVVWLDDYAGMYPACPRCREPAYEKDRCCFCGQKYYWEDSEP